MPALRDILFLVRRREAPTPESTKALVAFKTDLEQTHRAAEQKVAATMARPRVVSKGEPLRILHLSDLHFTAQTRTDSVLQPLVFDLRENLESRDLTTWWCREISPTSATAPDSTQPASSCSSFQNASV